jgi:hypothetical protein
MKDVINGGTSRKITLARMRELIADRERNPEPENDGPRPPAKRKPRSEKPAPTAKPTAEAVPSQDPASASTTQELFSHRPFPKPVRVKTKRPLRPPYLPPGITEDAALWRLARWGQWRDSPVFGRVLAAALHERGYTQKRAADALGYKNRGHFGNLLHGENRAWTEERMIQLLRLMDMPAKVLLKRLIQGVRNP